MLALEDLVALSLMHTRPAIGVVDLVRRGEADITLEIVLDLIGGPAAGASASALRARAESVLDSARRAGIQVVGWDDPLYPPLLAQVPDAPLVLWTSGSVEVLRHPTVAIVGSRTASPYGLETASRLAADLAAAGSVVVSGLARGIDSAAHRGALEAGGTTVAVLGSGVDVIYPPEHRALAAEIAATGAVLSELVPGTRPCGFHFPLRNRIISGLSLAVVVVEAAERSGSLITAAAALEQGRAVLAVPGNVLSGRHRGCHGLIRDGAAVVESAEDVLAELGCSAFGRLPTERTASSRTDDPVLRVMAPGEEYDLDLLGQETGLLPVQLLPRLLDLELRGAIRRVDGGRFVRAGRTC